MNVLKLISSFVIASLDVLLISYYFKAKYPAKSKNVYFVMAICIPILAITNYTFVVLEISYLIINAFVIYLLSYSFKINKKSRLRSLMFIFVTKITIEIIGVYLFERIFEISSVPRPQYAEYFLKIFSLIIIKYITYFLVYCKIQSEFENKLYNFQKFKLFSLIISFMFSYIIIFVVLFHKIPSKRIVKILIMSLIIYNIAFIMFELLQKKHNKMIEEVETLKKKIESDIQYNLTQENDYDQIRHIKHDIKAKYFNLLIMLKEHEYEKAINYIQDQYDDLDTKITKSYSGKRYIDATIDRNFKKMENDLHFTPECKVGMITYGNVRELDISILLECALTNVYEASEKVDDDKRYVFLEMYNSLGSHLCIKVTNSVQSKDTILFHITSKLHNPQEHGYGVRTIKDIANQYQGHAFYEQDGDKVILKVIIPLI